MSTEQQLAQETVSLQLSEEFKVLLNTAEQAGPLLKQALQESLAGAPSALPIIKISRQQNNQTDSSKDYVLEKLLGTGGMGEVYRAGHPDKTEKVAIKILRTDMLQNENCRKRFQQEAEACSRLSSPHLVSQYDYGIALSGQPYIVMEYIEGKSLDQLLKANGKIAVEKIEDIFKQACEALISCHGKGVIHRDLKPSNLMLADTASGTTLKLVDFGIARILDDGSSHKLTQTGTLVGSPAYMSPEQCQGLPLDERSDIYSLGCVIYEALSSSVPFQGENLIHTVFLHVNQKPEDFAPELKIPENLANAVMKCLAKDPSQRFQNAKELKAALAAIDFQKSPADKSALQRQISALKKQSKPNKKSMLLCLAAISIALGAFGAYCKLTDEGRFHQLIDKAELASSTRISAASNRKEKGIEAEKAWREAILIAERLNKPASTQAILHNSLAQQLSRNTQAYNCAFPNETESESEFKKALSLYRQESDSTSAQIKVLQNLTSSISELNDLAPSELSLFGPLQNALYQPTDEESIKKLEDLGRKKMANKDYLGAINAYEEYFDNDYAALRYDKDPEAESNLIEAYKEYIKYYPRLDMGGIAKLERLCILTRDPALMQLLDACLKEMKIDPDSFDARMKLADAAAARKDFKSAIFEATIALAKKNDKTAHDKLISWRKEVNKKYQAPGVHRLIQPLKDLANLQKQAFGAGSEALEESLGKLVASYLLLSDYRSAYLIYSQVPQNPKGLSNDYRLAVFALRDGDINLCISNLQKAIEFYSKTNLDYMGLGEAHIALGQALAIKGDYLHAKAEIELGLKIQSESGGYTGTQTISTEPRSEEPILGH
ncbi:MAG: serine/threonine protein kinase [Candidatus Obscuribacterales bacterium]|nr:serine/threonine protein kinase [Candidatus Obscuribacterales bacterium]